MEVDRNLFEVRIRAEAHTRGTISSAILCIGCGSHLVVGLVQKVALVSRVCGRTPCTDSLGKQTAVFKETTATMEALSHCI